MATKIIVIVGVSVAIVLLMFVLGKMAGGKEEPQDKQEK